jgi:flagellar hook-basal body complex protein FliE
MNTIQSNMPRIDPDLGGMIAPAQLTGGGSSGIASTSGAQAPTGGFMDILSKSMEEVNETQVGADQAIKDLVAGRNKNIHETMLAIQKAELSLKTMMQVRNKVLEAYKEIMRMQV